MQKLSLGERIACFRKYYSMTQIELAEELNLTDKSISKWEKDDGKPSLDDIQKLATIFKISLELLVKGISTESEKELLSAISIREESNSLDQELKVFLKKHFKKVNVDMLNMFDKQGSKAYGILDKIIEINDIIFYNLVNETYGFVKLINNNIKSDNMSKNLKYSQCEKPYVLTLEDVVDCTSLDFYNEVFNEVCFRNGRMSIPELLSEHLSKLDASVLGDSIYSIVTYLMQKGAILKVKVPFEFVEGYREEDKKFESTMMLQMIKDIEHLKDENVKLKDEIILLKRK